MNLRPTEVAAKTKVCTVGRFSLFNSTLLQQKCTQRMARWLHPSPRFVIGQSILQCYGVAQPTVGKFIVGFAILNLAVQHRLCDGELFKAVGGVSNHLSARFKHRFVAHKGTWPCAVPYDCLRAID